MSVIQLNDPTIGGVIDGNLHSLTCSSISATPLPAGGEILTMQDQVAFKKGLYVAPTVEGPTGHNVAIFNGNPATANGSILHVYDFQSDKDGRIYDSTINPPVPGAAVAMGNIQLVNGFDVLTNGVPYTVPASGCYLFNVEFDIAVDPTFTTGLGAFQFNLIDLSNNSIPVPGSHVCVASITHSTHFNLQSLVMLTAGQVVYPSMYKAGSGTSLGNGGSCAITIRPMVS